MFYAQRNAGYFRVGMYYLASIVADLPVLVAQALLTAVLVYGMTSNNGLETRVCKRCPSASVVWVQTCAMAC